MMSFAKALRRLALQEDLNFLLTNRIPRNTLTRLMGWFSRIESPWLTKASIAVWRMFTDLDLSEAKETRFRSLHDCFIRELKPDARPVAMDTAVLVSPCDGIVGEFGDVQDGQLFQAKGFPYRLEDLLISPELACTWENSRYITIRITSSMYHRFHAPHSGRLCRVRYISGDTWNVNPIALKRVESLFCKNERAVLEVNLDAEGALVPLLLVPVAAILVASIRLHGVDLTFNHRTKDGLTLESDYRFDKGQELGWFEHGSTIILFAPKALSFTETLQVGQRLKMGEPLLRFPHAM
jgi:phosphatidylserine decarboxylase